MKTKYFLLFILISLGLVPQSQAQYEWNWGSNRAITESKHEAFKEAYYDKKYEDALPALHWLLENTPDLHVTLYVKATEVYEGLAYTTENEEGTPIA